MEEIRAQAVTKLGELQKIKPKIYTARELHPRKLMLSRVQRQEQKRYYGEVQRQKVKLTKDISDIDKYLESKSEHDAYMTSRTKGQKGKGKLKKFVSPIVSEAPTIVFRKKPVLKKTRLKRYQRGGRF